MFFVFNLIKLAYNKSECFCFLIVRNKSPFGVLGLVVFLVDLFGLTVFGKEFFIVVSVGFWFAEVKRSSLFIPLLTHSQLILRSNIE